MDKTMEHKYKLTDETIEFEGTTLYRIEALKDFGNVKKGDKGGWVESEDNLSHNGTCWIGGDAKVFDYARIYDESQVFGGACVFGFARIYENAIVYTRAQVSGRANVYGCAGVFDEAIVCDNAHVKGHADVCGNAVVCAEAMVYGDASVFENAQVGGNACIYDQANIYGNGKVTPGLVFVPYILCDTVSITAEGTMAPKMLCNSRFALAEVGFHPEQSYLTFMVDSSNGNFLI